MYPHGTCPQDTPALAVPALQQLLQAALHGAGGTDVLPMSAGFPAWFQRENHGCLSLCIASLGEVWYPQSHLSALRGNSCTDMNVIRKQTQKCEKVTKFMHHNVVSI